MTTEPQKGQTFIPGKDAALEDSIQRMQQKLAALDLHIVEQSWLNPVANVWSVHIRDRDCPLLFTNGKGASKKAALASALGEFFERLSTHYFWADYYLGDEISRNQVVHYPNEKWFSLQHPVSSNDSQWPDGLLTDELHAFYNPEGELEPRHVFDINSHNPKHNEAKGVCALPFVCQRTRKTVYFPVNIIGNLYVSNGMSAGNTPQEARVQGLSEVFERYVKFRIIADGLCLPDIPQQVLKRYPGIIAGIQELESAGYPLLVKDASLGGNYPVICVTLLNPDNQGCYASFGAHPNFEIALERALTELLQGRGLDALGGFAEPGFDLDEIASPQNLETHFIDSSGIISWEFLGNKPDFEFVDWHQTISADLTDTHREFDWLCERIHEEGNDIYIMDHDELGVYACRILVPGMSEIYPVDDLIWENNNAGVKLREAILKTDKTPLECRELIEQLEQLNLDDQHPVASLLGLAPDKGTIWADLRIAELITLLALQSGDNERSIEGCQWLIHFQQIDPVRLRVYRCIDSIMQLDSATNDLAVYVDSLARLYGAESVEKALALIAGETVFSLQSNWKMHTLLTDAYRKITKNHPAQ